jgi:maltokinase
VAEQLLRYLLGARWFAGKGRLASLGTVTPLPWLTEVDAWPAVRTEVAEVVYGSDPEGDEEGTADEQPVVWPRELYQLVLSYRHAPEPELAHAEVGRWELPDLGPVVAYDAAQDPAACRVLLRELLAGRPRHDHDSEVGFHLSSGEGLSEDLEPRTFRGQQSNTSVMFGDVAMVKLFRRLELGANLDIEVHDALSRTAGGADVARLYGWIDARWPYGDSMVHADLAMAVEKLAEAEEGWALALAELAAGRSFAADAAALGRALAEIHAALRQAFPTGTQPGSAVAAVMRQRLAAAVEAAPVLQPHVDGLRARFDALAKVDLATQRVHGDFHLGQTLRTPGGWKIIDFEGEPAKTLVERAAPDSVWRDLAGMLRSFAYAAASVPERHPDAVTVDPQAWAAECRTAFLDAYAGGRLSPAADAVLTAYEADKAVYEVVYEVRNRPDWVGIPLAAVEAITAGVTDNATPSAQRRVQGGPSPLASTKE